MSSAITIAGGGLAGAAAACHLARAGRPVTVLERTTGPTHKICGEFLSHEAQSDLAAVGLDLQAMGAHPITHLRLARAHRTARIRLPFTGLGLSRLRLDEALLAQAAASGATIERGHVFHLDRRPPGILFVATGKHDARGVPRNHPPATRALVGFKTYFRLTKIQQADLAGHIELILFPDGYAGLQLIEDGLANLCLLTSRPRLDRAGGHWPTLLGSLADESLHLAARLTGAIEQLDRPLAIARTPFGFLHRPGPNDAHALFRLGDQAAVIPALTGDGMSIALHTARRAANTLLAGGTAADYHRRLHHDLAAQITCASVLYRLGTHRAGQASLLSLARAWPSAIGFLATLTRVQQRPGPSRGTLPDAARMSLPIVSP
jgi:flavin-dependent dehydrogenase